MSMFSVADICIYL